MGGLEDAMQGLAGAALEWRSVEVDDVAEDPGDPLALVQGEDLEGCRVRQGEHVSLLDAAEPIDGRPIEGHAFLECGLELGRRDAERLRRPEHVGEPELDEADTSLFDGSKHVVDLAAHLGASSGGGRNASCDAASRAPSWKARLAVSVQRGVVLLSGAWPPSWPERPSSQQPSWPEPSRRLRTPCSR